MSSLGDNIKALRRREKLSQSELSQKLNYTFGLNTDRVMISKWETGFQAPSMSTLVLLAQYFQVTLDSLNGDGPPIKSEKAPAVTSEGNLTEKQLKLLQKLEKLPPDVLDEATRYIDYILSTRDQEKR